MRLLGIVALPCLYRNPRMALAKERDSSVSRNAREAYPSGRSLAVPSILSPDKERERCCGELHQGYSEREIKELDPATQKITEAITRSFLYDARSL